MGILSTSKELIRPFYLKWLYFKLNSANCPPHFQRWRSYSTFPVGPAPNDLIPLEPGMPDFIFMPMADWHGITQRSQQLARALSARGHRSVYLNPHLGREFPNPYPFSPRRLASWVEPRVVELHNHLPLEPVFHHRLLSRGEVDTVARNVLYMLDSIGSVRSVSLISFPLWTDLALRLKATRNTPIIYDCHDLLEGFDDISSDILKKEAELLTVADLVVFSSDQLARKHLERNPSLEARSVLVRNAVDPADFTSAYESHTRNARPVIGYVGSLNSWFDVESVTFAARKHPEWQFELVGIMADSFPKEAVSAYPNIHLAGEIPYVDVPKTLAGMDVVMIPFHLSPLTMATNPIKLYEYFACGLPVVSSTMPEVGSYSDLVYLASSPDQFVRQLEAAVTEEDRNLRRQRRRIAERESWQARAEVLSRHATRLTETKEDRHAPSRQS